MSAASKRQLITLATTLVASVALPQQPLAIDQTFRTHIINVNVNDVLPRNDGNLIISGYFRFQGDNILTTHNGALLNHSGGRLPDFPEANFLSGKLVPWNDMFYGTNGRISRHFMDGTLDPIYVAPNSTLTDYAILQGGDYHVFQDGRALISGVYTYPLGNDNDIYSFLWLDDHGFVDTTKIQRRADGSIYWFKELPDGKFICYGGITEYEGTPVSLIFRIEADGSLDTTFNVPPLDLGEAYTYYPTADGKVVVGGFFHFVNAPDTVNLIRLLPNGQLDPTFNSNTDYNANFINSPALYYYASVSCILPIGNDRLIITGGFDEVEGQARGGMAMLDSAGNLLDDYFTGAGCGEYTYYPGVDTSNNYKYRSIDGIKPTADGEYYIFGAYQGYDDGTTNDTLQRFVSRLYGLNVGINELDKFNPKPLAIAPNPTAGSALLSVEAPLQNAQLTLHDASGRVALQMAWPAGSAQCQLPTGTLAPGAYVANVRTGANTRYSGRLVVLP
ncbi:MAG: T9SS type A sorting domain-containing protein [Flavobacteriales bacterium]|nr:T9SS type A sorting domain-containing protein [Flavobacteriales bacterium]